VPDLSFRRLGSVLDFSEQLGNKIIPAVLQALGRAKR
jgi:hypothetical protein